MLGHFPSPPLLAAISFQERPTILAHVQGDRGREKRQAPEAAGYLRADWDHEQPLDCRERPNGMWFGDGRLGFDFPCLATRRVTLGAARFPSTRGMVLSSRVPDAVSSSRKSSIPNTSPRNTWNAGTALLNS